MIKEKKTKRKHTNKTKNLIFFLYLFIRLLTFERLIHPLPVDSDGLKTIINVFLTKTWVKFNHGITVKGTELHQTCIPAWSAAGKLGKQWMQFTTGAKQFHVSWTPFKVILIKLTPFQRGNKC